MTRLALEGQQQRAAAPGRIEKCADGTPLPTRFARWNPVLGDAIPRTEAKSATIASVDLYGLPLGPAGHSVRMNDELGAGEEWKSNSTLSWLNHVSGSETIDGSRLEGVDRLAVALEPSDAA